MVEPEDQPEGEGMQSKDIAALKPVNTTVQSTLYFPRKTTGTALPIVHLALGQEGDTSKLLQRVTEKQTHKEISKALGIRDEEADEAAEEAEGTKHDVSMQSVLSVHPSDTAEMQLPDLTGDTKVKTETSEDVT